MMTIAELKREVAEEPLPFTLHNTLRETEQRFNFPEIENVSLVAKAPLHPASSIITLHADGIHPERRVLAMQVLKARPPATKDTWVYDLESRVAVHNAFYNELVEEMA
jgi:hypothetical protein